jgi:hypothetical protein
VKAWSPIHFHKEKQTRKDNSKVLQRINANLCNLAISGGREIISVESINIDNNPPARQYTSTVQVRETSVQFSAPSLPRGIVPGDSDVRVVRPPRPPSPVICYTSRKSLSGQKPIQLITPKVELVTFPENNVPIINLEEEDFGHVIDPLVNLYDIGDNRPVEEEETPTTASSEVEIVVPASPEADVDSEFGLFSEGSVGETRPEETDSTSVSYQLPAGAIVSVDIPESGPPPSIGLPAPISPLAADSEAECQEVLRILQACKPQSDKNI